MRKPVRKPPKALSAPEELFALQLRVDGIAHRREARVVEGRQWRLDFAIWDGQKRETVAVEIEGWGRHQRFKGFEDDCEKYAAALIAGWRVLRVTPAQVKTGQALEWLKRLL